MTLESTCDTIDARKCPGGADHAMLSADDATANAKAVLEAQAADAATDKARKELGMGLLAKKGGVTTLSEDVRALWLRVFCKELFAPSTALQPERSNGGRRSAQPRTASGGNCEELRVSIETWLVGW